MASTDTASPRSGKVRRAARVPLRSFDDDSVHYSPDEPGPFRLLTRIANGAFGETFAVRELDPRWSSGGSRARGRTLCMKVFVKDDIVAHQFSQQVVQELLAYKNLAWAEKTKGLSFVMQVEAALEDSQRFYFIMVSPPIYLCRKQTNSFFRKKGIDAIRYAFYLCGRC